MKKMILAAAAALGLSGCVYDGYGSGISVGYGSSYGYGGYGYGGYGYDRYGRNSCITHDRYGRAYYSCGYGNYYGSNRYSYFPRTVIYYYPGYSYRNGYYYDGYNRRYLPRDLYRRYHQRRHRSSR